MPLLSNRFQPYFPDPLNPALEQCGPQYCHPVIPGDEIFWQGYQTPCGPNMVEDNEFGDISLGAELVTNGTFTGSAAGWTVGTGWTYTSNTVAHTPGNTDALSQSGLGMVVGSFYRVGIRNLRTASSLAVYLGDGAEETSTDLIEESGDFTFDMFFFDTLDDIIRIVPLNDYNGGVDNVSVREITFNKWLTNSSWDISGGTACHLVGTTGALEQNVADYMLTGEYWKAVVILSGVTAGAVDVFLGSDNIGTLNASGEFTLYGPTAGLTADGVLSFVPTSDFIGCISFPETYQLRNDYSGTLVSEDDGSTYNLTSFFSYWEDKVTLALNFDASEIPFGCYHIEIFDACTISGNNLVTDGDFSEGDFTYWQRNNGAHQYQITAGQLQFIFNPLGGLANELTNGDFASGDFTGWTAGANWAVVGGKAVHTPGSTATLSQAITVAPAPAPPATEQWWQQIVISNRTQGSVRITFGNTQSVAYSTNETITVPNTPVISGSVNFTITPSSDFDGEIDSCIVAVSNAVWVAFPGITNVVNAGIVNGNYELEYDLAAQSDTPIGVGISLLGMGQATTFQNTVATHQISVPNYVPGAQQVRLLGSFRVNNNWYPGTVNVDNVSAVLVEPFEASYISECLEYRENFTDIVTGRQTTRMLRAWCDQPAFGFEFANSGFFLQQRCVCVSFSHLYEKNKQVQKSGNGNARVVYSEAEKLYLFATDYVSETFHDALSIMLDCDHFGIGMAQSNVVEYINEGDEYAPTYAEGYSLSPVAIYIRPKEGGQVFNRHIELGT